jgi:hypothetical protein
MKTILILTDHSPAAEHASVLALILAQHMKANIILANTVKVAQNEIVMAGFEEDVQNSESNQILFKDNLILWNSIRHLAIPEMTELDVSDLNETQLAEIINEKQIWMVVKNQEHQGACSGTKSDLNAQWILNKIRCPLLLVPPTWRVKGLEHLVYIADMRYCRLQVLKYMAEIAQAFEAGLSLAHISAKGLPDMIEPFATAVFRESICTEVEYEHLSFNNIKERDPVKATDVIINSLHSDILAVTNHRFHFVEIVGSDVSQKIPDRITVPILIFPY